MKFNYFFILVCLVGTMFLVSCGDDDTEDPTPPVLGPEVPLQLTVEDLLVVIDENPEVGMVLGVIKAEVSEGTVSYAITSQTVEGAMVINKETGELSVLNAEFFDHEVNESLEAIVTVSAPGVDDKQANVTINLNDLKDAPFITTWNIEDTNFTLYTVTEADFSSDYNFNVLWGDGTESINQTESVSHTYSEPGVYQIEIIGDFPAFKITDNYSSLTSIDQWGEIQWKSFKEAFAGCSKVVGNFTDAPDLSEVTDMSLMFYEAVLFNGILSSWDVSNVTDMSYMFKGTSFNDDISEWNTSKVENMKRMFYSAEKFNQDLGSWDVSNVIDMSGMFGNTNAFNADISRWNVSKVTNMERMFYGAEKFNQPIGSWDVSSVTDMSQMFPGAAKFSQDLGDWNLVSIENLNYFMSNTGMSTEAYDVTLIGWAQNSGLSDISIQMYGLTYCNESALNTLVDRGWSFIGHSKSESCD